MEKLWLQDKKILMDSSLENIFICQNCPCDETPGTQHCICNACTYCNTVVVQAVINGVSYYAIIAMGCGDIGYCTPYYNATNIDNHTLYETMTRSATTNTVDFGILTLPHAFIIHDIIFTVTEDVDGVPTPISHHSLMKVNTPITISHGEACGDWGVVHIGANDEFGMLGAKNVQTFDIYKNVTGWENSGTVTFWVWFGGPADDPYNPIFGSTLHLHKDGHTIALYPAVQGWRGTEGSDTYYLMMYDRTTFPNTIPFLGTYVIYKNDFSDNDIIAVRDGHCGGPVGTYGGETYEVVE